ncbi:MAG: anti-sigma F factor [Oscillospiraceae bacterium]|jgi:stage II sporulation protein AB (anti-sigma F factor)|nr:anti-sigma F factor [Oscillospiraceae bacterium]
MPKAMLINEMKLELESRSINESFARATVAAFCSQLDPSLEELSDIKTAVSEAVTNAIVHGYAEKTGKVYITARIYADGMFEVAVKDKGCGIPDIAKAREPLFTTGGADRAGLGFAVMESFTDKLNVRSAVGKGTTVTMRKKITGKSGG